MDRKEKIQLTSSKAPVILGSKALVTSANEPVAEFFNNGRSKRQAHARPCNTENSRYEQ